MTRKQIDSEVGKLVFWGSECLECGNATPDSLRCDACHQTENTTSLWMDAREWNEQEG